MKTQNMSQQNKNKDLFQALSFLFFFFSREGDIHRAQKKRQGVNVDKLGHCARRRSREKSQRLKTKQPPIKLDPRVSGKTAAELVFTGTMFFLWSLLQPHNGPYIWTQASRALFNITSQINPLAFWYWRERGTEERKRERKRKWEREKECGQIKWVHAKWQLIM